MNIVEMLNRGTYTKLFFIPGYKQIKHLTFMITQGLVFLFITQGRCSVFCNTGGKVSFSFLDILITLLKMEGPNLTMCLFTHYEKISLSLSSLLLEMFTQIFALGALSVYLHKSCNYPQNSKK